MCIVYKVKLVTYTLCYDILRNTTVLSAKSDSDVMFSLHSYQERMIDRLINKDRKNTQVEYQFALAQVKRTCLCFAKQL